MRDSCRDLADYIFLHYFYVAEIGIGRACDVGYALAEKGVKFFATDIKPLRHKGLSVVTDDITRPDLSLYRGVDLIYSLRPPPELVFYMNRVAAKVSADLIVKPLSSEYPGGQLVTMKNSYFYLWSHGKNGKEQIQRNIRKRKDHLSGC